MVRRAIPRNVDGLAAAYTLAPSEVVYDGLNKTLRVGDGETPGGIDLANTKRASLLDAAQYRKLSEKVSDRFDLRDVLGADISGNNDNLSVLQIAMNEAASAKAALHLPAGLIACSGTLEVPSGFTMQGAGRSATGPASRVLFTGTAPGFVCGDGDIGTGIENGFLFRDIVTSRIQPAVPSSGTWEPIDAEPDFVMYGSAQLDLEHVLFLNATRGVNMQGGGGIGRLNMSHCGGQVFIYGVNIELCADVCKFDNVHWWPYWEDKVIVNAFCYDHTDHFFLKRCDTPQFSNISSISARAGVRFSSNSYGKTTKAQFTNAGLDYARYNIWFDPQCDGASAWFNNATMQANNADGSVANSAAVTPRINVKMEGTNDFLSINGCDFGGSSGPAVWVVGTSEECHLDGGIYVHNYGTLDGSTDGCFVANAGNRLSLHTPPRVDSAGAGQRYDGVGYISSPDRRSYVPTVTFGAGSGQTVAATGTFRVEGKRVYVDIDFTFTAIGTGGTDVRFSLPYPNNTGFAAGYGSGVANTIAALACRVSGNVAIVVLAANQGYPGLANGDRYLLHFEYEITG